MPSTPVDSEASGQVTLNVPTLAGKDAPPRSDSSWDYANRHLTQMVVEGAPKSGVLGQPCLDRFLIGEIRPTRM